ncbi:hypothetical protein M9Y10_024668 [Tritrichomonas musculus]|uniref:Uncharacterized protein n=1 Tax=Tritrichomonas musculus TaxID=1915356 RepID=A0ABR2HB39_9EUKA
MEIQNFLAKMKKIESDLLDFIEHDDSNVEDQKGLEQIFGDFKDIFSERNEFKNSLTLLVKIANNHFRQPNFFKKINSLLTKLKDQIKQSYSNSEIFEIFKSNKKILLFLIKEQIITVDSSISGQIIQMKYFYREFFFPEIKEFLKKSDIDEITKKIPDNFEEKREIGENDSEICEIIRNDSIDEFSPLSLLPT